jgi:flavodoxin I
MGKTAIIYGSTTGNTESIANQIKTELSDSSVDVLSIADTSIDEMKGYDNLILGTSTWGLGDLQDDWEGPCDELSQLGKQKVALFGLGDCMSYPDTFVDGMGQLYEAVKQSEAEVIGFTSSTAYDFDASVAQVEDEFVGLVIDEDNESDKTTGRISEWVESIRPLLS